MKGVHRGFSIINMSLFIYFSCIFLTQAVFLSFLPPLFFFSLLSFPCWHTKCTSSVPPSLPTTHEHGAFSAACLWLDTDSRRCKHTREGHRMCELLVLFPFDKLSSVGTAQGFDPTDLSTPWKTVNTLPDPLLCLCVWTFHSPLMRISPNYFSGCSRGTAVYLDLDTGTWLLCW